MQLIEEPAKIAIVAYGSSCQAQALRDAVMYLIAVMNVSALLSVKAAAFEAGIEPCRRFDMQKEMYTMHGVNYSRKCHFYSRDIYDESVALLALSTEDLFAARSLVGEDPGRKLHALFEYVGLAEEQLETDAEAFYAQAQRIAAKLAEMAQNGAIK